MIDYILPPQLLASPGPLKKFQCIFKPSLSADAAQHSPLFFMVEGRSDNAVRAEARIQLRQHLRDTKHPLASPSYWFMSCMNEVPDE